MKLNKNGKNLGLPEWMKFGLELEVENLDYEKITERISKMGWHSDKDMSLIDSGTECVSPVLKESENSSVWEEVKTVCDNIKECSADGKREPYTDHTCGGHVHFDAQIFMENPEMMKNLLRLWAESEELVYKMCNEKNDPIRPGAINKSNVTFIDLFKTVIASPLPSKEDRTVNGKPKSIVRLARETLNNTKNNLNNGYRKLNAILADILIPRQGMAAPIGAKIKKQLEAGNLKLAKPKSRFYKQYISKQKLDFNRNSSLNLTNFGKGEKNTIEFRLSNGTINPETIKQNVFLYASLINTSVEMTKNPEKYADKLQTFYQRDVSEEEKAKAFLELIMDDEQDRQIYMDRWESVKDAPVFSESKGAKQFETGTFNRETFKTNADRTPATKVKEAFTFMSTLKDRMLNMQKEDLAIEH